MLVYFGPFFLLALHNQTTINPSDDVLRKNTSRDVDQEHPEELRTVGKKGDGGRAVYSVSRDSKHRGFVWAEIGVALKRLATAGKLCAKVSKLSPAVFCSILKAVDKNVVCQLGKSRRPSFSLKYT